MSARVTPAQGRSLSKEIMCTDACAPGSSNKHAHIIQALLLDDIEHCLNPMYPEHARVTQLIGPQKTPDLFRHGSTCTCVWRRHNFDAIVAHHIMRLPGPPLQPDLKPQQSSGDFPAQWYL